MNLQDLPGQSIFSSNLWGGGWDSRSIKSRNGEKQDRSPREQRKREEEVDEEHRSRKT